jgi:Tol biopolymer transport system component
MKAEGYMIVLLGLCLVCIVGCGEETSADFESRRNRGRISDPSIHSPCLSLDGRTLIFDSFRNGNWDVLSCDLASNRVKAVVSGPLPEFHPVLAPDSDTVAFVRQSNGFQHIWKVSLSSNRQEQVTKGFVIDRPVTFANEGSNLVFIRSVWPMVGLMPREALFVVSMTGQPGEPKMIGSGCTVSTDLSTVAGLRYDQRKRDCNIWVKRASEKGGDRLVGLGSQPTLSQDEDRVAAARKRV